MSEFKNNIIKIVITAQSFTKKKIDIFKNKLLGLNK